MKIRFHILSNTTLFQNEGLWIGKPVIIIKDTKNPTNSDLGSIEYIEYLHAHDLMQKLTKALELLEL